MGILQIQNRVGLGTPPPNLSRGGKTFNYWGKGFWVVSSPPSMVKLGVVPLWNYLKDLEVSYWFEPVRALLGIRIGLRIPITQV